MGTNVDVLADVILMGYCQLDCVMLLSFILFQRSSFVCLFVLQHLELLELEVAPFMDITIPGVTQMLFLKAPLLQCCGLTFSNQCICIVILLCLLTCGALLPILWTNITWVQLQTVLVVLQMHTLFIQDPLKV